jgi:hypothetical protein
LELTSPAYQDDLASKKELLRALVLGKQILDPYPLGPSQVNGPIAAPPDGSAKVRALPLIASRFMCLISNCYHSNCHCCLRFTKASNRSSRC